ncbi:MAG TPA: PAS domain S-box protein, partial [Verrucomicrobiae bacterium]|nr:PAS domain S-box protein [Verrucomicrobiae bacterium]
MARFSDESSPLEKVVGLGEKSIRKTYYPELQRRMAELERFRALLDETGDIILVISCIDGRVLDANERALVDLGMRDEVGKVLFTDLVAAAGTGDLVPFVCTTGTGRMSVAGTMRTRDGRSFPVDMTLTRVVHDGGWYTIAICRDVTDRVQAEELLRREAVLERVNQELEERVRERTRELEASRRLLQRIVDTAPVA